MFFFFLNIRINLIFIIFKGYIHIPALLKNKVKKKIQKIKKKYTNLLSNIAIIVLSILRRGLRPQLFNLTSCPYIPSSFIILHLRITFIPFNPTIILIQVKIALIHHFPNCQPPLPNIMHFPKQLKSFPSQAKPFNNIIEFCWLLSASQRRLFTHNNIRINIRMYKMRIRGPFNISP